MNSYLPAWASAPNFQESVTLTAMWEGSERAFEVTFNYDRVYFRVKDEPKRVFAALEACSEDELESSFKSALSSGEFGFYFVAHNYRLFRLGPSRQAGPHLQLRAICHRSGVGWIREWSSPDWLWFNPKSTRALIFAPDYLFPHDGRKLPDWLYPVAHQKRDELYFRDVSNAEFNGLMARWVKGSDEEFLRVAPLLWKAGLLQAQEANDWTSTYRGVKIVDYNPENQSSRLWFSYADYIGHPQLRELLSRRLYFCGYDWAPNPYWTRKYRSFFSKNPRSRARFEQHRAERFFSLANWETPSSHEQLEASLELRTYLEEIAEEENVSEQDLDSWCVPMGN